ncbi:hypothetical protein DESC_960005 [Desulfosarcina cetonica]|nr:hypothetical protein DESC_960005 [Desulfosarcina cetonica]
MLSKFSNEVLSHGPSAVLPQNLTPYWLQVLQKRCDDFLDANFATDQCIEKTDMGDPLLMACVHEATRDEQLSGKGLSADELAEKITIYAFSITMETIRRESDMEMTPPTLENLLAIERIVAFGKVNPAFGQFLKQACVVSDAEKPEKNSWFQQLKKKILSRVSADE